MQRLSLNLPATMTAAGASTCTISDVVAGGSTPRCTRAIGTVHGTDSFRPRQPTVTETCLPKHASYLATAEARRG